MADNFQRRKGQSKVIPALNTAIDDLNLAKEATSTTLVNPVFGSAANLLTMIRDTIANEQDYVDLGLCCADICKTLERRMHGKTLDDLSKSARDAINQLTMIITKIQGEVLKRSGRRRISRLLNSKDDNDTVAAWKSDLNRLLHVFDAEPITNTHPTPASIFQDMSKICEDTESQNQMAQNSVSGMPPPPPPRVFCGRHELINRIVRYTERLTSIGLIGAGGIGKSSIILTALHNDRIKRRFGPNRRFIRCDEFPASRAHFLRQLSKAIGAGIENPEDLSSLLPFLSSKEILIVLDNAEPILDAQGPSAPEIRAVVNDLTQVSNVCVWITSRISTVPPHCETINIPTLSAEAAQDTFYHIYKHGGWSSQINDILEQLDYHPSAITSLATIAQDNQWDTNRLTVEWEKQRTGVLSAQHSGNLATMIEPSLASPTFRELGPSARELLELAAFFPQGFNEKHISWLFPTIPDVLNILNTFCTLSLTHRNNGFITMLAPLRDHLRPKDPALSSLLVTTKECYFKRLSNGVRPSKPGFEEAQWITTEDLNAEHLLGVFTTIDADSKNVWDACSGFMDHLYWHKSRLVTLGPKIEALPDDHPSKAQCLWSLSCLFDKVGNFVERKRLLSHALKLWRKEGNNNKIAQTLRSLSDTNRRMGLYKEGILQAEEASEIYERFGYAVSRAGCLITLASLLRSDGQLDAAEKTISCARDLLPTKGEQSLAYRCHRVLGEIYYDVGETKKATHHFVKAFRIASSLNRFEQMFWIHYRLAQVFSGEGEFVEGQIRLEQAKSLAVDNAYLLAHTMYQQARMWDQQDMLDDAESVALRALDAFGKLGAVDDAQATRRLLHRIETRHPPRSKWRWWASRNNPPRWAS